MGVRLLLASAVALMLAFLVWRGTYVWEDCLRVGHERAYCVLRVLGW